MQHGYVYLLVHTPTNSHYIGSTTDPKQRRAVLLSHFRKNKASKKLQALWTGNPDEWQYAMTLPVPIDQMREIEEQQIARYIDRPGNLNTLRHGKLCGNANSGRKKNPIRVTATRSDYIEVAIDTERVFGRREPIDTARKYFVF